MSAIDRELLVMRGFAASRGDDDAIGEAQRDVEAMRAKIAKLITERDQLRAALVRVVESTIPIPEDIEGYLMPLSDAIYGARLILEATK